MPHSQDTLSNPSRLSRLLTLLETGSSIHIRETAATQLGDIIHQQPSELFQLLARILPLSLSNQWDTRIACGLAIGSMIQNSPLNYQDIITDTSPSIDFKSLYTNDYNSLKDVYIIDLLDSGAELLSSAGKEFEVDTKSLSTLQDQKKTIQSCISIPGIDDSSITSEFIKDEDLQLNNMSARERNIQKRKIKLQQKSVSKHIKASTNLPTTNLIKSMLPSLDPISESFLSQAPPEIEWPWILIVHWLSYHLDHPQWTHRHGSATSLYHLLKAIRTRHSSLFSTPERISDLKLLLYSITLRTILISMIDRFGDYATDQAVAPVRTAMATLLGELSHHIHILCTTIDNDQTFLDSWKEMIYHQLYTPLIEYDTLPWQAKQGALLDLQYLLETQKPFPINSLIHPLVRFLSDSDDDVKLVSADLLYFLVSNDNTIINDTNNLEISLWKGLETLDELNPSTCSFMSLLGLILNKKDIKHEYTSIDRFLRTLWNFFRHPLSSVRIATLSTLQCLLQLNSDNNDTIEKTLLLIFQNMLLEKEREVLNASITAWNSCIEQSKLNMSFMIHLLRLLMVPLHCTYSTKDFFLPKGIISAIDLGFQQSDISLLSTMSIDQEENEKKQFMSMNWIGECRDSTLWMELCHIRLSNKIIAANAFGMLMNRIVDNEHDIQYYYQELLRPIIIQSEWSFQRQMAIVVLNQILINDDSFLQLVYDDLYVQLEQLNMITFEEVKPHKQALIRACERINNNSVDTADLLEYAKQISSLQTDNNTIDVLNGLIDKYSEYQSRYMHRTCSMYSSTFTYICMLTDTIPSKMNPVIRPLVYCLKYEMMQKYDISSIKDISYPFSYICNGIARLFHVLVSKHDTNDGGPHIKMLQNIISHELVHEQYSNGDDEYVSLAFYSSPVEKFWEDKYIHEQTLNDWIWSIGWEEHVEGADIEPSKLLLFHGSHYRLLVFFSILIKDHQSTMNTFIFPFIYQNWISLIYDDIPIDKLIIGLRLSWLLLQAYMITSSNNCPQQFIEWISTLITNDDLLGHDHPLIRFWISQLLTTFTIINVHNHTILIQFIDKLSHPTNTSTRQLCIEYYYTVISRYPIQLLCYFCFLIIPVMKRMSDSNNAIRLMAAKTFSILVQYMPVEQGIPNPKEWSKDMCMERDKSRKFSEQLLCPNDIEPFKLPIELGDVQLRPYQQDGINWLAFLNRYGLHGVLCDDMGLGKTLQTLCMIASDHYLQRNTHSNLISLIICPTSLLGHWYQEAKRYVGNYLTPKIYAGSNTKERRAILKDLGFQLLVVSYEVVRNDLEHFLPISWNYIVLDEGHVIKNPKARTSISVKMLKGHHRLVLTGTPIQNTIVELWSLFDFLMPGYLGSLGQFMERYAKPILACKDSLAFHTDIGSIKKIKSTKQQQKAHQKALLALEALHKQTLPFLLRRMKDQVLKDLPPKIIQDYYCNMNRFQRVIYDEYIKYYFGQKVEKDQFDLLEEPKPTHHIFQFLQTLRKICNHPGMIFDESFPVYQRVCSILGWKSLDKIIMDDYHCSAKLVGLHQLLSDMEIGTGIMEDSMTIGNGMNHRALIFCQSKHMMDIVEEQILKACLKCSYLKLDGSIPGLQRQDIVSKFNADPTIDILLLTTSVGGQGLTLTGADTVIFVECDWNPTKDLQAMDRAHRLGQKRTVQVFRFIVKDSIEEKLMSLQQFKLTMAGTIVTQQNNKLSNMNTDMLMDMLQKGNEQVVFDDESDSE